MHLPQMLIPLIPSTPKALRPPTLNMTPITPTLVTPKLLPRTGVAVLVVAFPVGVAAEGLAVAVGERAAVTPVAEDVADYGWFGATALFGGVRWCAWGGDLGGGGSGECEGGEGHLRV